MERNLDDAKTDPGKDGSQDTSFHARRAAAGEIESLDWIVRRFSPLLLAQARFRMSESLRRFVPPEDVVQEVWAVGLDRLPGLRPRAGRLTPVFLKFLSTVCLYRVQTHRRALEAVDTHYAPANPTQWLDEERSSVVTRAIRREAQDIVMRALEELPGAVRDVLVLRIVEQRPAQEVAELLRTDRSAVYVRQHRAIELLRRRLPPQLHRELQASVDDLP